MRKLPSSKYQIEKLKKFFVYDANLPLNLQDKVIGKNATFEIHDITYASLDQDRLTAILVKPKGTKQSAGILFRQRGAILAAPDKRVKQPDKA